MKTLKYAVRFLMRSRSYTVINLLGLAFSLACCIILMRYIHRELTVDTHCIDRGHVYAICTDTESSRGLSGLKQLNNDTMSIDQRLIESMTTYIPLEKDYVLSGNCRIPARCLVTDSTFFRLFRYPLVQGTMSLHAPQSAMLTEAFARKVFGSENPVGKVLRYSNGKDITVEGILGDPGCKTTLNFDIVLSSALSDTWERMDTELYRFLPGTDIDALNRAGSTPHHLNPYDTRTFTFSLIPMEEIYWSRSLTDGEPAMFLSGDRPHVAILSGVCLLLLLTGVLNFVNLYLVVLLHRGKEYGLKKVFGASGKALFASIWMENTLLVLSALLIAWLIIEVTSVPMARLLQLRFAYTAFDGWLSLGILLLLPPVTSIYPFVKYNYASPILSIRSIGWGSRSVRSRMVFLGVQYVLTFLLVVLSLYFNRQLDLLLHTEPGFRTYDIINAKLVYESKDFSSYTYESMQQRHRRVQQINNELNACPFIELYESSYENILTPTFGMNYLNDKGEKTFLTIRYATPAFFRLYGIRVVEGSIPEADGEDRHRVLAVNRAALKALGYTSLAGAMVVEENRKRADGNASLQPIVAVVEDYYEGHLTSGVKPTIYSVDNDFSGDLYQIAYTPGKKKEVLDFLRKLERKVYGSEDFEYSLMEDEVKAMYEQDRQTAAIYTIFSGTAIAISCLGLFGISLFDIRQRYREIGIRKINGAQLKDLYPLLFRKYLAVLGVAFLLAIPLACYAIHTYTQGFAVKASLSVGTFAIGLAVVALISMGTLAWQVRKAAGVNPAEVMKTE